VSFPSDTLTGPGRGLSLYGEELQPGALVAAYVVDAVRFRGAVAILYRARHVATGKPAALKVMRSQVALTASALRRFAQEAALLQGLSHPNVVQLLETGELSDGRPFLVMEWLEGRDLAAEIAERGALSSAETLSVMEQVAQALAAAHRASVIHRDLKAQNVMVRRVEGRLEVKLVDFGIARLLASERDNTLTSTGRVLGTPIAMAPEQIHGADVDARTDIYALGVLLYQLLTGQVPFHAANALELVDLHLNAPAPRPSARAPVPTAVDDVVRRCLEKRPENRFSRVEDVVEALRAALARRSEPAPGASAALYLEATAAGDDPDDAALDLVDSLLEAARDGLPAAGFELRVEGGNFLLATAPLPGPSPEQGAARGRQLAAARALWRTLEARARGGGVRLALALHAEPGESAAALLTPGAWARAHPGGGLAATEAMLEGLAVERRPVAGRRDLFLLPPDLTA
jgi:eukaryotic-like serine/threonine-protein kinase